MARDKCTVKRITVLPFEVSGNRPYTFTKHSTILIWLERTYKTGKKEQLLMSVYIRPMLKTDGASTFWPFTKLVPHWRNGDDEYNAGPVAHDILYIKKGIVKFGDGFMKFSREEVDDILRGIWRCWGMSRFLAGCADKAIEVVAGGNNHWGNDSYHVKEFCDVKVEVLE